MFTPIMLSAMLAMTFQPASHPSKPSTPHGQTAPSPPVPAPAPPQTPPAGTDATRTPAAKGAAVQGEVDHSPAARQNWDHRRAYYWQEYKRPHRRAGHRNAVTSGVRASRGAPSPPVSVQAVHNLDATVTVTRVMSDGVIQPGDIFEVGRRRSGQQDFWKIGEATAPRYVDRQLQTLTSGTQYAVAVRRAVGGGNVWSPMSAVASTHPNHPLTPQRSQPVKSKPAASSPPAESRTDAKPKAPASAPAPSAPR